MRMILIGLLVAGLGLVNDIARINKLKSEAHRSYMAGDYQRAVVNYQILIDSFNLQEHEILMNYANAAFMLSSPSQSPMRGLPNSGASEGDVPAADAKKYLSIAQDNYGRLAREASASLKSLAFNQLGVMAFLSVPPPKPSKEVLMQAQGLFKSSLRNNSQNEDARFNYELVSKMLKEEEQQQDQQDKQDQEKKEEQEQEKEQEQQENQDQQEQKEQSGEDKEEKDQSGKEQESEQKEGEPKQDQNESQEPKEEDQGEQKPQETPLNASPEKMEEMKISEEKARMILEAMKNAEIQYIQQNKRKATKKPESGKPDW